ncbi:MAG: amidase domain-containing protein, partial [Oscillospiraceae bacterium]|nr:amidase domain-containing protein [Oscillospiraceae bacterium]
MKKIKKMMAVFLTLILLLAVFPVGLPAKAAGLYIELSDDERRAIADYAVDTATHPALKRQLSLEGGDCASFSANALLAAGISFDITGSLSNSWFTYDINKMSSTWNSVGAMRNYLNARLDGSATQDGLVVERLLDNVSMATAANFEAQPGDLVMFGTDHMGIMVGGKDNFASHSSYGIKKISTWGVSSGISIYRLVGYYEDTPAADIAHVKSAPYQKDSDYLQSAATLYGRVSGSNYSYMHFSFAVQPYRDMDNGENYAYCTNLDRLFNGLNSYTKDGTASAVTAKALSYGLTDKSENYTDVNRKLGLSGGNSLQSDKEAYYITQFGVWYSLGQITRSGGGMVHPFNQYQATVDGNGVTQKTSANGNYAVELNPENPDAGRIYNAVMALLDQIDNGVTPHATPPNLIITPPSPNKANYMAEVDAFIAGPYSVACSNATTYEVFLTQNFCGAEVVDSSYNPKSVFGMNEVFFVKAPKTAGIADVDLLVISKVAVLPNTQLFGVKDLTVGGYSPVGKLQGTVTAWKQTRNQAENEIDLHIETYGQAKIIKQSEDGIVSGIPFTITGNGVNKSGVTGQNGELLIEELLPGTYTVTEGTVDRYVTPQSQTVTVQAAQTAIVNFSNVLKKFRVTVQKKDSEYNVPQGDAKLSGAVYGLYNGPDLVATYTTDINGRFTTDYFVCGDNWSIREISPSAGYLLDSTVYHVGAEATLYTVEYNDTALTVPETVKKGKIAVVKHDLNPDPKLDPPNPNVENPMANVTFRVWLVSKGSYNNCANYERNTFQTNENGYGESKLLPYGLYRVEEIADGATAGHDTIQPFTVFIDTDGKTHYFIIRDDIPEAYIRIVKKDAETGVTIPAAGVTFKIRDLDTGKYVVQKIMYPTPVEISEFLTDDTGRVVTAEPLQYNVNGYEIVEAQAGYGYLLNTQPLKFIIRENSEDIIELLYYNAPAKGTVSITKTGNQLVGAKLTETEYGTVYAPVYEPR